MFDGYHITAPHEPTEEWIKETKQIAWNAHKEMSKRALDIGSEVHRAIHGGVSDNLSDEARACLKGYKEFIAQFFPVKITSELTIYDPLNKVAGTIDDLSLSLLDTAKNKTLYIIDWKTSSAIQRNYKIQITVYKWMLSNFIKLYLKNPANYDESTQKILNTIIQACGKKPKIKCILVRLNKKLKARILHETVEIKAAEEKAYLAEFKTCLTLKKLRKDSNDY